MKNKYNNIHMNFKKIFFRHNELLTNKNFRNNQNYLIRKNSIINFAYTKFNNYYNIYNLSGNKISHELFTFEIGFIKKNEITFLSKFNINIGFLIVILISLLFLIYQYFALRLVNLNSLEILKMIFSSFIFYIPFIFYIFYRIYFYNKLKKIGKNLFVYIINPKSNQIFLLKK